ncbi:triose-phosphate isomerase [Limosilactobacillus coleohominis]|uniref:Triosephosphate isomerase n=1 Tax=Limosilactobacillus coleohominis TaxID=181675 RepID=A0ABS2H2E6_9LACO|nr:triose-phosphate isomerase [Limosilactobacillus coleohominis]MBM6941259.1 triose-phosphate isomerase [Limosilactobacillus coleohominis]
MRKPFIVANWKMHKNVEQSVAFLHKVLDRLPNGDHVDIGIAPQSFATYPMIEITQHTNLQIISQNAATKYDGAYTGEISVKDLKDMGINYVMLGHSERRRFFHESNQIVNQKVLAAANIGVTPIVCTNEDEESIVINNKRYYILRQLHNVLQGLSIEQLQKVILSFEPTSSIGEGHEMNLQLAERGCQLLRQQIRLFYGNDVANRIRILYGGSVNPENIAQVMDQPDVDGVLIGRASLDPEKFVQMANYQNNYALALQN